MNLVTLAGRYRADIHVRGSEAWQAQSQMRIRLDVPCNRRSGIRYD